MGFSNRDYGEWEILDGPYPELPEPSVPQPLPAGTPHYTPLQHLWLASHNAATADVADRRVRTPVLERLDDAGNATLAATAYAPQGHNELLSVLTSALSATTHLCHTLHDSSDMYDVSRTLAALHIARTRMGDAHFAKAERLARNIAADYGDDSCYALAATWFEQAIIGASGGCRLSKSTHHDLLAPWYDALDATGASIPVAA